MKITSVFYDEQSVGAVLIEVQFCPQKGTVQKTRLIDATNPNEVYPLDLIKVWVEDSEQLLYPPQQIDAAGRNIPNPLTEIFGAGIKVRGRQSPLSVSIELRNSEAFFDTSQFSGWALLQRTLTQLPKGKAPATLLALAQALAYARGLNNRPQVYCSSKPISPARMQVNHRRLTSRRINSLQDRDRIYSIKPNH